MKKILSYFDLKPKIGRMNKTKKSYFVLFFFFIIGFAISIVAIGTSANNQDSPFFKAISNSIDKIFALKVAQLFVNALVSNSVWLIISYFLGVSAFGYPFIFIIPFIIGLQKGTFLTILLINSGIGFFIKSFLCLIFQNSLLILILIYAVYYSLKMSAQTFNMVRGISRFDTEYIDFKKYSKIFIILFFVLFFLSLTDAFLFSLL